MSEMVDRAVHAAYLAYRGWGPDADGISVPEWSGLDGPAFVRCIRAAIAAMREPTDEMAKAGACEFSGRVRKERGWVPQEPKNTWQAMIDTALKE